MLTARNKSVTSVNCSTPCAYYCLYNQNREICLGCFRTKEEIKNWVSYTSLQQTEVMALATQRLRNFTQVNVMPANFDRQVYFFED